jgi:hypothetical protein
VKKKKIFPRILRDYTVKKRIAVFPSPGGMSLTKLSLAGKNLIIPGQRKFGKWHPGWDGKTANIFYSVNVCLANILF